MRDLAVVYLAWRPAGFYSFMRFIASYEKHPADWKHDLIICFNGNNNQMTATPIDHYLRLLEVKKIPYQVAFCPEDVQDLRAYTNVIERTDYRHYCLLNSYTTIQVNSWLKRMVLALQEGPIGAFGSQESWVDTMPQWGDRFPSFPNPHLRTNGVLFYRSDWLDYPGWERVNEKEQAWQAESGRDGWSQWLLNKHGRLWTCDREGRATPHEEWVNMTGGFRQGQQDELLFHDSQTEAWDSLKPEQRALVGEKTWGTPSRSPAVP